MIPQYKPVSKMVDMNHLRKSPLIMIKKYKEAVYFGELKENKKIGHGVMLYTNGRVY